MDPVVVAALIVAVIGAVATVLAAVISQRAGYKKGFENSARIRDLAILDVLDIPVWVLDQTFKVVYLNASASTYYGRSLEEVQSWTM